MFSKPSFEIQIVYMDKESKFVKGNIKKVKYFCVFQMDLLGKVQC